MYPLPIPLLLPIENGVLIPRHHLLLARHLRLPTHDAFRREALTLQRGGEGGDDGVDEAQAFALASLLGGGQFPRDFPEECWCGGEVVGKGNGGVTTGDHRLGVGLGGRDRTWLRAGDGKVMERMSRLEGGEALMYSAASPMAFKAGKPWLLAVCQTM